MNSVLISMFNKEISSGEKLDPIVINGAAMKCGYLVHPSCCTKDVYNWLEEQKINPNATFYKTWKEVIDKNRLGLVVDQLIHYFTTYGTNFSFKNGYVPNEKPEIIPYKDFKIITPASPEEIFNECCKMLKSGIALHTKTIDAIVDFLKEYNFIYQINLNDVKNKEVQAILSVKLGTFPDDEFGMLRSIIYRYTNSTMLIKSSEVILTIKNNKNLFNFNTLSDTQLKKLSRIFYRYKPLFLAMKTKSNKSKINKIRKYATVYHTPLKKGFWEVCLTKDYQNDKSLSIAKEKISELNNYRKVQLMQSIKERLIDKDITGKMFLIRNGKMFIRDDYKTSWSGEYFTRLYKILEDSLIENLKKKSCSIKLPKNIELSCPTSEKNFIGNLPFGSYIQMSSDHNVFGIYWRNEWGAKDLDLWYTDKRGNRYGWAADYYDKDKKIIFSGDMTNANPEASELFYLGRDVTDGNVSVNLYCPNFDYDESERKFKIFIASENCENSLKKGYMVEPNNIIFETELSFDNGNMKKIGCICNGKFVFMNITVGNQKITATVAAEIIQEQMNNKTESYVDLRPILEKAGFNIVDEIIDESTLDFSEPKKSDLINLFS